jgi:DNA-binding MarR family transcriptional regulator
MREAPISILDLDEYVPYWMASISRVLVEAMQAKLLGLGLTIAEWRLMVVIAMHGTTQAIDISRRTRMDQVAVHRAIKSLIAKNMLKRQAQGQDMRRKPLQLTRKGLAVYQDMQPAARDVEGDLLRLLDARERKILRALLGKLYRATRINGEVR